MTKSGRPILIIELVVIAALSGCTTMVSQLSIEPYIQDKAKRNALETLAEQYCLNKRGANSRLPDYIFTTDACSRWPDSDWGSCCIAHDIAYWCGGSEADRIEADSLLMACANKKMSWMGNLIYFGVRIGGIPWLPTPWRWGYGWEQWPGRYENSQTGQSIKNIYDTLQVYDMIESHLFQTNPRGKKHEQ